MRSAWKAFLAELPYALEFLHRDEFQARFDMKGLALPAIFFRHEEDRLELWIDAETIAAARSLEDLISVIRARLARNS
jgi:hypothetical protein